MSEYDLWRAERSETGRLEAKAVWPHIVATSDDACQRLQERLAKVAVKVLARLHAIHPRLKGKTLEETIAALKAEKLRRTWDARSR